MYRISLINMPFANVPVPSLALMQLDQLVKEEYGEDISSRILYLNQDVANYFGLDLYMIIADSSEANLCGFGDWLFRKSVFPETEQDAERYLAYAFRGIGHLFPNQARARSVLLQKRRGIDAFLDRLIDRYKLTDDDLVGFTSVFCQNMASFALAKKLKERKPGLCTVMGGANCESPMGQEIARNVPHVDYVFSGPALRSFPEFVGYRMRGQLAMSDRIKGVFNRRNVKLLIGPASDAIGEELPISRDIQVDYRPFLKSLQNKFPGETHKFEPILFFETSRGCWWGERAHCTFCGLNGSSMAYRSVQSELAVARFRQLFEYWPQVKRFAAVDNIMPKTFVSEVLPNIAAPEGASIFYEVKADLSREDLHVLAKAGVTEIQPGLEALSTPTLKLMKKGLTAFQNIHFLKNCIITKVNPVWNILIGFPGEPEEIYLKYLQDFPKLVHLPPPSGIFPVRFDRYSPYFEKAESYGLKLEPSEHYRMLYPFPAQSLANMGYFFEDKNLDAPYIDAVYRHWERLREGVSGWRMRWDKRRKQIPPTLSFRAMDGETIVWDARGLVPVTRELSERQVRILEFLSTGKGRGLVDINYEMGADVAEDIRILDGMSLLFSERDRYISLVLPADSGNSSEWRSLGEILAGLPT